MTRDKLQTALQPPLLQQLQLQDFFLSVGRRVVTCQQRLPGSIEVIISQVSTGFISCVHNDFSFNVLFFFNDFSKASNQKVNGN